MSTYKETTKHDRIQAAILSACHHLGINAVQEHKGLDWRADVYVQNNDRPIAFEIQLSPQSLRRTLERQSKYSRDGVIGCWFFENPVAKLNEERPDLPLFYVEDREGLNLQVNLGDRRKIDLNLFLQNFISDNIQFKRTAITKNLQHVNLVFYKMKCWKCSEINHLYFVDGHFHSACNAKIRPNEGLWQSNNIEYRPEIVELARRFADTRKDLNINLGQSKNRYSGTVQNSYTSFGCHKCDSIFGDFYVMEAKMEMIYQPKELTCEGEIQLQDSVTLPIQHWCFPDNKQFCGS